MNWGTIILEDVILCKKQCLCHLIDTIAQNGLIVSASHSGFQDDHGTYQKSQWEIVWRLIHPTTWYFSIDLQSRFCASGTIAVFICIHLDYKEFEKKKLCHQYFVDAVTHSVIVEIGFCRWSAVTYAPVVFLLEGTFLFNVFLSLSVSLVFLSMFCRRWFSINMVCCHQCSIYNQLRRGNPTSSSCW